jgi:PAS domain S-box-containing protein
VARKASEEAGTAAHAAREAAEQAGAASQSAQEAVTEAREAVAGAQAAGAAMPAGNGGGVHPAGPFHPAGGFGGYSGFQGGGRGERAVRPLGPRRKADQGPQREQRPGFDDAPEPKALIGLDGRFKELNPGFTDLVGFSEHDFKSASWPPVTDRKNLEMHRDQMQQMLNGDMDSAEVRTGYVHAQGLLVPVVGRLSLVRDDSGEPAHFTLEAQDPKKAA